MKKKEVKEICTSGCFWNSSYTALMFVIICRICIRSLFQFHRFSLTLHRVFQGLDDLCHFCNRIVVPKIESPCTFAASINFCQECSLRQFIDDCFPLIQALWQCNDNFFHRFSGRMIIFVDFSYRNATWNLT